MSEENYDLPRPRRASATPWVLFLFTLGGLAAVLYYGWTHLDELQSELKATQERVARAEAAKSDVAQKQKAAEEQLETTKGQLDKLQSEKEALASSNSALAGDLQAKEAEIARLKSTYDSLEDKLKSEIKKGEIKLTNANGQLRVDLVDKVLFDSGQADLAARGKEVLSRVAEVLKGVEDRLIQVSGHTDDSPLSAKLISKYPTNWELSAARAVNVVRFLQEQGKVPPKRLVAAGYGQFHPVVANSTPVGRAQNRRIEILLTPEMERPHGKAPAGPKVVATKASLKKRK